MECSETERLRLYVRLKDPILVIFNFKIIAAMALAVVLYVLIFVCLPYIFINSPICIEGEGFDRCRSIFDVSHIDHWRRGLFVFMMTIFLRLWYVYFKSSFNENEILPGGAVNPDYNYEYSVQSLRRFLTLCASQWQGNGLEGSKEKVRKESGRFFEIKQSTNKGAYVANEFITKENDEGIPLNEAFRRKASMSVEVAALFMVIVTLMLDKSSDVISNFHTGSLTLDLWGVVMLLISSVFGIISFICFLVSVDSLDTTFNKFVSKSTRHVALQYFYQVTSNPRYSAVVSMMMSMIFFFAFYSVFLGTFSVTVLLYIGYRLWFPDIRKTLVASGFNVVENCNVNNDNEIYAEKRWEASMSFFVTIVVIQIIYLTVIELYDAGLFSSYF